MLGVVFIGRVRVVGIVFLFSFVMIFIVKFRLSLGKDVISRCVFRDIE